MLQNTRLAQRAGRKGLGSEAATPHTRTAGCHVDSAAPMEPDPHAKSSRRESTGGDGRCVNMNSVITSRDPPANSPGYVAHLNALGQRGSSISSTAFQSLSADFPLTPARFVAVAQNASWCLRRTSTASNCCSSKKLLAMGRLEMTQTRPLSTSVDAAACGPSIACVKKTTSLCACVCMRMCVRARACVCVCEGEGGRERREGILDALDKVLCALDFAKAATSNACKSRG